jgi:hypothetical protein
MLQYSFQIVTKLGKSPVNNFASLTVLFAMTRRKLTLSGSFPSAQGAGQMKDLLVCRPAGRDQHFSALFKASKRPSSPKQLLKT